MAHNNHKWYEVTYEGNFGAYLRTIVQSCAHVGLWCRIPKLGTNFRKSVPVEHNSKRRYKVIHDGACGAQLQKSVQSLARVGV